MKLRFLLILLLFSASQVSAQRNLIGKSQKYIKSFYKLSGEYHGIIDTINQNTILLTYKSDKQYPFYTYEIDLQEDKCISYGIVSKDHNTLMCYLDLLDYIGELVEVDSTYNNFTYQVKNDNRICYFSIKQPYYNSQFLSRRGLFYILITEKIIAPEIKLGKEEN